MNIHESGEMYLESIYVLKKEKSIVRSVDVGQYMNFSKPSVSRAIGILRKSGYVEVGKDGEIILTETGKGIAEKIYERHNVLKNMLIKLGVDEETAVADACRIEHVISDRSFQAIKNHIDKN